MRERTMYNRDEEFRGANKAGEREGSTMNNNGISDDRIRKWMLPGLIIAVLAVRFVLGGFTVMSGSIEEKIYTCAKEVKSINIQGVTSEIIVRKGKVDRATVTSSERENDPVYKISESGGELSIVQNKKFRLFNFDAFKYSLSITIPDDLDGELEIDNKSGSIQISDLTAEKISIDNVSGNVLLEEVVSEKDLTVNNVTGSVTLTDVKTDGSVEVHNTTGKIQTDELKSKKNISLKTVTGSITGTISGKESDYSISAKVVTGSNNLSDSSCGDRKLKVSTTTGSIKLTFTK